MPAESFHSRRRRRTGCRAGSIVTVAAVALGIAGSAAPAQQAELLAFTEQVHPFEVYISNADGSGRRALTDMPAGSRWPALSPAGNRIAFARKTDGRWCVFTMKLDGTELFNVSAAAGLDGQFSGWPDWSPDGAMLVFSANRGTEAQLDVFVYELATGTLRNLTPDKRDELDPAWSPDGRQIAFTVVDGKRGRIQVVNADGSGRKQVTHGAKTSEAESAWSPDGKRIAFTRLTDDGDQQVHIIAADGRGRPEAVGPDLVPSGQATWSRRGVAFTIETNGTSLIYLNRLDGSLVRSNGPAKAIDFDPHWSFDGRRIVFASVPPTRRFVIAVARPDGSDRRTLGHGRYEETDPALSPDGRRIAFTRSVGNAKDVYVMDVDGRNIRNLTPEPGSSSEAAWSPDGDRIAYATSGGVVDRILVENVWVMNADGSGKRRVGSANGYGPSWSPDGKRLVYSSIGDDHQTLRVLTLATNVERTITTARSAEFSPAWSPDGRHIAFVAWRPNSATTDIWVASPDGSGRRALTHDHEPNSAPAWSPDSRTIVFEKTERWGNDRDLWTIPAAGGRQHRIDGFGPAVDWAQSSPSWRRSS